MPPACSVFIVFPPFRDGSASRPFILCGARAFAAAKASKETGPMRTWFSGACFFCYWRRVILGPVPGQSYCAPAPGRPDAERQRKYGRPATGPLGEKLSFSPTFFAPQAGPLPLPSATEKAGSMPQGKEGNGCPGPGPAALRRTLMFLSDAIDQVHCQSAQDPENGQDNVDFKLL